MIERYIYLRRRLAAVGLLLVSVWLVAPRGQQADPASNEPPQGEFVQGEVLVKFRPNASSIRRNDALSAQSARLLKKFDTLDLDHVKLRQGQGLAAALAAFRANPDVLYVQPNYIRHTTASAPPNDPYWTDSSNPLWGLVKIMAQPAWTNFSTGDGSVVVADIDTGVNYNHPDLAANMWRNPGETGATTQQGAAPNCTSRGLPLDKSCNNLDDDGNGYVDDVYGIDPANGDTNPMDDNGHGTHTAGTIGAVGNNGIGVVGVNWNVKILACKFLKSNGSGSDADAITCFSYITALKNRGINIRVSSNSWGGARNVFETLTPPPALMTAIEAAGSAGILNMFAAGNAGTNNDTAPFDPASYPSASIVSVAATDSTDARPSWSNFGATTVDLAAPGDNILSTFWSAGGTQYNTLSGTSMATPHVAGAAALLFALRPSLTISGVKAILINSVDVLGGWSGLVASGGRLNVFSAALAAVGNNAPTVNITAPTNNATLTSAPITVSADAGDGDGWVSSVTFLADGTAFATDTTFPYTVSWSPAAAGAHTLTAIATDNLGATTTSAPVSVTFSPPTYQVSGTVTLNGAGLSGVTLTATNGVSCTTTTAAGQYSCTVTQGWTGTVTPALSGYTFAPALRSYTSVAANQTLQNYTASVAPLGTEIVWIDDAVPAGAAVAGNVDSWLWVSVNPAPFAGTLAHQSALVGGVHQHYFYNASATLPIATGDKLFAYVYLDSANPPSEVMLQWNDGAWDYRAYWGGNAIDWGADGTASRRYMGALPATGQWVRLEVPANLMGLEGHTLSGMAFTLFGGRATWDKAGKQAAGSAVTYQVSGAVTLNGGGLSGVTLTATNGVSCSTTNAAGQYSCTVPQGWSGSVTPSLSGYGFTPASRSYSNVATDQTLQNYTASAVTYQVSGTVTLNGSGLSSVTLAATNGVSCSTTTASGQYSCTVPQGWSGSVTPSFNGYTFTPASRSYTNVAADQTLQIYTASVVTYQVSGTVTLNGSGLGGVTLTATNGVSCSTTTAAGQYSCTVPPGWSGSVTPSLSGYTFTPASRSYTNVAADQTLQTYTASAVTYQVSGTVTLNGSGLAGVALTATNGVSCSTSTGSGQYSCTVPQGWSGSVTPALNGYTFTPASRSYANVAADQTLQIYSASIVVVPTFQVSGTVTLNGGGLSGVTLTASNGVSCSTTTAAGQYSCTVPQGWTGTVTPSLSGYTFAPASRSYTSVAADQTLQTYTATSAPTGTETVWVDDAVPAGAAAIGNGDSWLWVSANPAPFAGTLAHQSALVGGVHQHYFYNASATLPIATGDKLFAYVYLDPANPPSELMLQWNDGDWNYRAYWGANAVDWGADGTASRRYMGALPATGQWVRLEVPANLVGLEGHTLSGMAFTLFGGRATWDKAGKQAAGSAVTYQVSGTVTLNGSGLSGATLTATNGISCSTTTAAGQYSCTVPQGWSGSVTPSLVGYSFTPASRSYSNVAGDQTLQTYTASVVVPTTYQVSGTVTLNGSGLSGVTLTATNGVSCSTTNAAGQYSCTVPQGWTGSVTPALSGYNFTPASRSYTNVAADQTLQTYTASVVTYQVSGTVTLNGSGLSGVALTATNGVSCSTTTANGQYSCTVPQGWTGSVTPALSGYTFTPASRSYTNVAANQALQTYTASAVTYQVSGTVTLNGSGLGGVALTATNGVSCTTTTAAGQYSCTVPQGWTGTVTPSLNGYTFTPTSRSYSNVAADQTLQTYTAGVVVVPTYQVSGSVTLNGSGLIGVTLTATNGVSCTTTTAAGQYGCTVPQGWTGTVTPSLNGYTFAPASRGYSSVAADQTLQTYSASAAPLGTETIWVDDAVPAGAAVASNGDNWLWVSANPTPFAGTLAHQSANATGLHQHYFYNAGATLRITAGDKLFAYVYLDPANPPSELMLQWSDGAWDYRAYWGANAIDWGTDATASRRYMGALPATGQWIRLEVPANLVGLEGHTLNGMAFTLFGGRATWDKAGKQAP